MKVTVKHVEQNIRSLPHDLLEEVNDYVNFLKIKFSGEIPDWQKEEVLKRKAHMDKYPQNAINEDDMLLFINKLENEI